LILPEINRPLCGRSARHLLRLYLVARLSQIRLINQQFEGAKLVPASKESTTLAADFLNLPVTRRREE